MTVFQKKKSLKKDDQVISVPPRKQKTQKHLEQQTNKEKSSWQREIICNANLVIILGDSMIKHLDGWKMPKNICNPDQHVVTISSIVRTDNIRIKKKMFNE